MLFQFLDLSHGRAPIFDPQPDKVAILPWRLDQGKDINVATLGKEFLEGARHLRNGVWH